jgi:signal peptidase I
MSAVQTKPAAPGSPAKPAPHTRDAVREVCETIAFVVALVLMLKLFVVEAFVIPTGSMAETLFGDQKIVTCPECQFLYPVNSNSEVQPQDNIFRRVSEATCPNCRHRHRITPANSPHNRSGDRVLVHKGTYSVTGGPARGDVVVFKYPVDPQQNQTANNYIKRLWGLGGETLAVWRGDVYISRALDYPPGELDAAGRPKYPRPDDPLRLWERDHLMSYSRVRPPYQSLGLDFTYHNTDAALEAFDAARRAGFPAGGFELARKTDGQAMAMRRIVYDNDHQSEKLAKAGVPPRWQPTGPGWSADDPVLPKTFTHAGGELSRIRYAHRVPTQAEDGGPDPVYRPTPVTNFLGYNAGREELPNGGGDGFARPTTEYWVGDLMLECTAKVSGPQDVVELELSKGISRFRARFAGGRVTLVRVGPGEQELATAASPITGAGEYALRFANVDCRLRVWVNDRAIGFGPAADYSPSAAAGFEAAVGALGGGAFAPRPDGHTVQNDIQAPASVAASGGVAVSGLKLWSDTYFTPAMNRSYENPEDPVDTFYVQPGHYFVLGDNSGQSSDSRKWGLVPERLMLGKAIFVFWPFSFSYNRIGFIE